MATGDGGGCSLSLIPAPPSISQDIAMHPTADSGHVFQEE